MSQLTKIGSLALVLGLAISLQACSRKADEPPMSPEAVQENHSHAAGTPAHDHEASADWVEIETYKFKLDPEIEAGGEAHLDLYVHDTQDQHVSGAQAVANLTAADGHKLTVDLAEDTAGKHYAGKTTLEDMGDYEAVVQVTVNGKKMNPRFSFSRNK